MVLCLENVYNSLLYTLPVNSNRVCPIPYKYIKHYCEASVFYAK